MLVTDGEVPLTHFAGLESAAVAVLLAAVEVALQRYDPAIGYGQSQAEGASVLVRVRRTAAEGRVTVRLAEGRLTGPNLLVTVTATEIHGSETTDVAHVREGTVSKPPRTARTGQTGSTGQTPNTPEP